MKGILKIIITLTIVVVLTPDAFAIKCFDCRSEYEPKCGDPFDNSTVAITDCDRVKGLPHLPASSPSMCRKIKQKVNGEWSYTRGCAYSGDVPIKDNERFCLTREGTYQIEYSTCNDKDGCNLSYMITPTPLMLVLLIGFSCFLKFIS